MVRRRGISLMEIAAAGILLAAMLAVCVQFFQATAAQRRGLEARRTALQTVANVMERLGARPWDQLTTENASQPELLAEVEQALPDGQLEVEIVQPDGEPDAKRITVVARWSAGSDPAGRSVRLVAWRYRARDD